MKVFTISSWIPKLKEPNIAFNLSPPSYQEITQIIKCMKFSGSPCPLNQISIYCFNLCPYLRPHICTKVLRSVKNEKFTNFRYCPFKCFLLWNWFQFTDDAIAVTSSYKVKIRFYYTCSENDVDGQNEN